MKKSSVFAISLSVLAVLWMLIVIILNFYFDLPWMCWGSITYTAVAVAVIDLYLLALRTKFRGSEPENSAIGLIITSCYFLITILLNSLFVLLNYGDFNLLLLILNIILVVCYIIILLWIEKSSSRLSVQLEKTEYKMNYTSYISRKIGELISMTTDKDIKARYLKLKEAVDYSNNISTQATLNADQLMCSQLDELAHLTLADTTSVIILEKIDAVEMTWKMRSNMSSSVR